ncbi:MAG TPA: hypothetical protein PK886_00270 [Candidatus Paceibacterota bacterium]|nr:hypothetical protein [Candidatus Paceibacterota bacterium]
MTQNSQSMTLSKDVSTKLPIFQVLGNQLPESFKTPEAKKTGSKLMFWLLFAGMIYGFVKILPIILASTWMAVKIALCIAVLTIFVIAYPHVVNLLHRLGRVLNKKGEIGIAKKFHMETLRNLEEDADDTYKKVRTRITQVEGVRTDMITSAEADNKSAEEKFEHVRKLTEDAGKEDQKAINFQKELNHEKSRQAERRANELRQNASILKLEGESTMETARSYAQYANEFGKAIEILRDNESAAKIFKNALSSSIRIIEKKLEATDKMKAATDGIADIFGFKNKWEFQVAMDAAQSKISNNIASIKRNLEFVNENNLTSLKTASQSELETFVQKIDSGHMKKLNVAEITDPHYELSKEEKPDSSFNILN